MLSGRGGSYQNQNSASTAKQNASAAVRLTDSATTSIGKFTDKEQL